jgi:CRISPR-associated protein Csd1
MLNLLVEYARRHNLTIEPGFLAKPARWAIAFDAQGRFLEVTELGDTTLRRNTGRKFDPCPHLEQPELVGGTEDRCHFLIEAAQVVALYGVAGNDAKTHNKHRYFVGLLRKASEAMPQLAVLADTLVNEKTLAEIQARLKDVKARPTDKVTFMLGGSFPIESAAWHDWWRLHRKPLAIGNIAPTTMRSFQTGAAVNPVLTMPKAQGLAGVGGLPTGDALICFDKEAFRSYGLEQSTNCAISEENAWAVRAALNDLLDNHSHRLAGIVVTHWFAKSVTPADDPLAWLYEATSDEQQERHAQHRAAELLQSIRTGKRPDLADNRYYALTLSGAAGRIMVRDWMEGQFAELVQAVAGWFSDLSIVNLNGQPAKDPGIERVITSLLPPRRPKQAYDDWVRPLGAERINLWRAALNKRTPIPHSALARLVTLNARFHQTGQLDEALDGNNRALTLSLFYARMGLMKAYHIRKGDSRTMPALNEDHPHPAYHCGRLMAVYAALQRRAQGDVGAGVVQRYYAAASSTPGLILGRLARLGQFHLAKLEPGLAHWFESKLAGIWNRIKDQPPTTLTLEEQSLFALGYYQQMAADRAGKPESQTDENTTKEEN